MESSTLESVHIKMPGDVLDRVKQIAREHDRSVSSMISRLCALSLGLRDPEPFKPITEADRAVVNGKSQLDIAAMSDSSLVEKLR